MIEKKADRDAGDRLKELIDPCVYRDILKTHAKEALTFLPFGHLCLSPVNAKDIAAIKAFNVSLLPFENDTPTVVPCEYPEEMLCERAPSLRHFSKKQLDFSLVKRLLIASFSPHSSGSRPYPSAGGLYSIEPIVFLFEERISHDKPIDSGCYHFKPVHRTLELIKMMDMRPTMRDLFHGLVPEDAPPNICILYVMHIGKSIFKYRYRGYRHALMEVGSMYQQVAMVAQSFELGSTVWSSFNDYQVMQELGLNRRTFLPLTMQFLGYMP